MRQFVNGIPVDVQGTPLIQPKSQLEEMGHAFNDAEKLALKEKIWDIQDVLLKLPQLDVKITHHFSKGVYAREMFLPKGALIVGKIHKHQNLNILSSGEVSVLSIDGCIRVKAPYAIVASPGAKRVIYAHEDTIWTTIHGTDETDLEKIEEEFIAKDYDDVAMITESDLKKLKEAKCLG